MNKLKNVFLIDDDEINNFINEKVLSESGRVDHVLKFLNGKEAMDHITESSQNIGEPDLILLDLNMPVMDGFEFLSLFSTLDIEGMNIREIPVIVLSSSVLLEDEKKALKFENVKAYIVKPLTIQRVHQFIDDLEKVKTR